MKTFTNSVTEKQALAFYHMAREAMKSPRDAVLAIERVFSPDDMAQVWAQYHKDTHEAYMAFVASTLPESKHWSGYTKSAVQDHKDGS